MDLLLIFNRTLYTKTVFEKFYYLLTPPMSFRESKTIFARTSKGYLLHHFHVFSETTK